MPKIGLPLCSPRTIEPPFRQLISRRLYHQIVQISSIRFKLNIATVNKKKFSHRSKSVLAINQYAVQMSNEVNLLGEKREKKCATRTPPSASECEIDQLQAFRCFNTLFCNAPAAVQQQLTVTKRFGSFVNIYFSECVRRAFFFSSLLSAEARARNERGIVQSVLDTMLFRPFRFAP